MDVLGAEEDVERRRRVGFVDVDQAPVEHPHRRRVLPLQEGEPVRLEREQLVQRVQSALVQ